MQPSVSRVHFLVWDATHRVVRCRNIIHLLYSFRAFQRDDCFRKGKAEPHKQCIEKAGSWKAYPKRGWDDNCTYLKMGTERNTENIYEI